MLTPAIASRMLSAALGSAPIRTPTPNCSASRLNTRRGKRDRQIESRRAGGAIHQGTDQQSGQDRRNQGGRQIDENNPPHPGPESGRGGQLTDDRCRSRGYGSKEGSGKHRDDERSGNRHAATFARHQYSRTDRTDPQNHTQRVDAVRWAVGDCDGTDDNACGYQTGSQPTTPPRAISVSRASAEHLWDGSAKSVALPARIIDQPLRHIMT